MDQQGTAILLREPELADLWSAMMAREPVAGPARTRLALMAACFDEIMHVGYRAASLTDILARAKASKGALYHHFKDKRDLGLAAAEYFIGAYIEKEWLSPLSIAPDPIQAVKTIIRKATQNERRRDGFPGCPLLNVGREMAWEDDGFRTLTATLLERMRASIVTAMKAGQRTGVIRADADPSTIAITVFALRNGIICEAQITQNLDVIEHGIAGLFDYLDSLRPGSGHASSLS